MEAGGGVRRAAGEGVPIDAGGADRGHRLFGVSDLVTVVEGLARFTLWMAFGLITYFAYSRTHFMLARTEPGGGTAAVTESA